MYLNLFTVFTLTECHISNENEVELSKQDNFHMSSKNPSKKRRRLNRNAHNESKTNQKTQSDKLSPKDQVEQSVKAIRGFFAQDTRNRKNNGTLSIATLIHHITWLLHKIELSKDICQIIQFYALSSDIINVIVTNMFKFNNWALNNSNNKNSKTKKNKKNKQNENKKRNYNCLLQDKQEEKDKKKQVFDFVTNQVIPKLQNDSNCLCSIKKSIFYQFIENKWFSNYMNDDGFGDPGEEKNKGKLHKDKIKCGDVFIIQTDSQEAIFWELVFVIDIDNESMIFCGASLRTIDEYSCVTLPYYIIPSFITNRYLDPIKTYLPFIRKYCFLSSGGPGCVVFYLLMCVLESMFGLCFLIFLF